MTGNASLREIGSEFHWLGMVHDDTLLAWPEPRLWMAAARDALVAVWHSKASQHGRVLHVPEYFCGDVVDYWRKCGIAIRFYPDTPIRQSPDWDGLNPHPGDMVLAVNYFGIRAGTAWTQWHTRHPEVTLIEDHSHDPFSHWICTSDADYGFASVRKTFPVADGAILWSPRQHPLPAVRLTDHWDGSARKLAAMILKREYLLGAETNAELKQVFRRLQVDGENQLTTTPFASIAPWSKVLIEAGFPTGWRAKRSQNVRHFIEQVGDMSGVETLFTNWDDAKQCPFNPILVFPTESIRERVQQGLIAAKIYPAVHWELVAGVSEEAQSLSRRILTIPLDQRYDAQDVKRCAETLADLVARQ